MPEPSRREPDAVLTVDNLSVDALTPEGARRVIDGISFALAPGETLCIAGESGSGKSVTALSIMRLLPRTSLRIAGGDISLDGTSLPRLSERYRRYLAQTDTLMDAPTVRVMERILDDQARMLRDAMALREQMPALRPADAATVKALAEAEADIADLVVDTGDERQAA